MAQDDLDTYFQLNAEDLSAISRLRGDANRLGFALQLGCLRYLGFFPGNLRALDASVVGYVGAQLSLGGGALVGYARREPTLYAHQQQLLAHLDYRRATPVDLLAFEDWLLARALEHDQPKLIFDLGCDFLRRQRIVRPGTTRLAQLVGQARSRAQHVAEVLFRARPPVRAGGLPQAVVVPISSRLPRSLHRIRAWT